MMNPVLVSRVFGLYLLASGVQFALVLQLLGLPVPSDAWVRIVGLLSAILGM